MLHNLFIVSISYQRKSIIHLFSNLSSCYNTAMLEMRSGTTNYRRYFPPEYNKEVRTMFKTLKEYFLTMLQEYGQIHEMNNRTWRF